MLINIKNSLIDPNNLLSILEFHIALLSATLVFIGFVQMTLSNMLLEPQDSLKTKVNYITSMRIISRIRLIIGATVIGAISSYFSSLHPIFFLAAISNLLLVIALIGVGALAYGVTQDILFSEIDR